MTGSPTRQAASREGSVPHLTTRQREVLALLAKGRSNPEIADALGVSLDGAKWHVREIMAELNVPTREDAAEWWREYNGLPARLRRLGGRMQGPSVMRRIVVGTAGVGLLAATTLVILSVANGTEAPGASGPRVVRQVFTERSEYDEGATETVAETWTLVGEDGGSWAFIGRYFDSQGRLVQAQYRTPDYELVYWVSPQGTDGGCVERAPPSPQGLEGLVPQVLDDAAAASKGYAQGGQLGVEALPADAVPPPSQPPLTSKTVDLASTATWFMSLEGPDGSRRHRVMALDADGAVVGFWSATKDPSGTVLGSNSRVVSAIETYEADVFDGLLSEVGLDDVPDCR